MSHTYLDNIEISRGFVTWPMVSNIDIYTMKNIIWKLFAKFPNVPGVDSGAVLSLCCTEVEIVSIAAFKEE